MKFRACVSRSFLVCGDQPQLDKYAPCVSLIDDVFRLKWRGLLVAGYASAVMLAWFGSLMYLVERDDNEVQVCESVPAFAFRCTTAVVPEQCRCDPADLTVIVAGNRHSLEYETT